MHLIVQIPCFNEAEHVAEAIAAIPKTVAGFDKVSVLVIDDGSVDDTSEIARRAGADFIVRNTVQQGLARSFLRGLEEALQRGADVIVNFDADLQYKAEHIPRLTQPILAGHAEMVVGARPIEEIEHFSWQKKLFQRLGSWVVRQASGAKVEDAPSGFRALSRHAAMRLFVFSDYTYTLETLIQAGRMNIPVQSVQIGVNPPRRPSRLMKNSRSYIFRSVVTIVRISFVYYPLRIMLWSGFIVGLPGAAAVVRFLAYYLAGDGGGKVQSLILGSAMLAIAALFVMTGFVADLIAANRRLLQEIRVRQMEAKFNNSAPIEGASLGKPGARHG